MRHKQITAPHGGSCARHLSSGVLGLAGLLLLCGLGSGQPAEGGKFLDAKFCSDTLNLNPGSDFDNGSCQLWKLLSGPTGWSRLQLKRNGKFLDANYCHDDLRMNSSSDFDGGSCQLWKFVADPVYKGWSRVQIKRNGKFLTAENCVDPMLDNLMTDQAAAWQLWRLVPDNEQEGWAWLQVKCVVAGQ